MARQDETDCKKLDSNSAFLPLCITSYRSKDEAEKLVSCLHHEGSYFLCFSYGLYTGTSNELKAKVEFALDGPFVVNYATVPMFMSASFCHLLMFNDGSIKGFKCENNKFETIYDSNVAPKLDTISLLTSSWLNASFEGVLYTCNKNISYDSDLHTLCTTIYSFDFREGIVERFYATDGEEIISFDFISREDLLDDATCTGKSHVYFLCLLKSCYSENLLLKEYNLAGKHGSRKFDLNEYRQYNLLPICDNEFCYMKVVCDHTIVVLTNNYTQIINIEARGLTNGAFFNNKGLPNVENYQFLKDSYDVIYERSVILLTIFDVYANKYTAKIHTRSLHRDHVLKELQWTKERVFKLPKHDLCDVILQLPREKYIAVTRINGVNFISKDHRGSKLEKVKSGPAYTNKVYLASQVIGNKGTDIDSLLLGGSFNSRRGFLEKKILVYDKTLFKLVTSSKALVENVTDFWVTDLALNGGDEFAYESGGLIYKNGIFLMDEPYDYGLFVSRTGKVLKAGMDGSTGEFRQVDFLQSNHNSSTMFCYPVQNSKLRISILEAKSGFLRKKEEFFIHGLNSKESIVSCFSDGAEKYLFVIYLDGVFSVWNANQKKVATSHPDYSFIAYDQLIKISWLGKKHKHDSIYVIASSYTGCVRVYKSESNFLRVDLEIHSLYDQKLELLDTIPSLPLVFLYNDKEIILLNLQNMSYGCIQLGLVPRRMRIRPGKALFSLCVLDYDSRISIFEFGSTFYREGFTKQMTSLKPQLENHIFYLPSIPVELYTVPNNLNQAVVCLVDSNSRQYKLMLFNYASMKAVSTFSFSDEKYLHAVVKPLWPEQNSIYLSQRPFYGNKFVVCLGVGEKRTKFWLFEIRNNNIIQLYANYLEDCIFSVFIYYECNLVLFSGDSGIAAYKINMLKEGAEILEAYSFPALSSINHIGLPAYMSGDYLVQFEILRDFLRTRLPIRTSIEYPSEYPECPYLGFKRLGSITQVATKIIPKKLREPKNDCLASDKNYLLGRLSDLSCATLKYSNRSYVATIGIDNTLTIYEDSKLSVDKGGLVMPYLKIRLPNKIISLAAIPDGFQNLQICPNFNSQRLEGVIPLFLLCGTEGQIYIISEFIGELWMRTLHDYKKIKLECKRAFRRSEKSMRNVTKQYSVSKETGINESGFDELARNSKRRHIDHSPYKTIDFFDPVKLKR
ncbi:CIC_collapsed_G0014590.mRNA.1.CDS.1 [Saccharomyces cerevisiae]|nr:hypothetical protein H793_YJM1307E00052 [Saccharomyces cerevisiae YJM1307]CAI4410489.1 CLN_G0014380.mRNA.1.CDS.1 [Saccharomyces cerevisiae]CAI5276787.1 ADM_HP2_G0013360.mRNA.1.CDS.1 [Saccharomyces cerevisiae]CAI6531148.1 ADM_HP2_G0013360.mRNA.1.CDS.1 [Saccharomyces cerevisiae]CAI6550033.1 ADM_HP1_G0013630.mRNA.1.CDS.1 [Saccharomyces cerevisiae]